jgi:hypothetical protein
LLLICFKTDPEATMSQHCILPSNPTVTLCAVPNHFQFDWIKVKPDGPLEGVETCLLRCVALITSEVHHKQYALAVEGLPMVGGRYFPGLQTEVSACLCADLVESRLTIVLLLCCTGCVVGSGASAASSD